MSLASNIKQIKSILDKNGQLSEVIEGFQPRKSQIDFALKTAEVIDKKSTLLAEAGTGTGKTFAYLVPALLSGKTVVISTATKNLQEQLIEKDLPTLLKLLKINDDVCMLKGRDNYFCEQRFEIAETGEVNSKAVWEKLDKIRVWSEKTKQGDKSECGEIEENDMLWKKVTARMEFCQATECHAESDCFYPKVKKRASEARVIVVNHHLFCADLALKEKGYGEVLPPFDIVVFDEAHKLPDIASQFLGFSISYSQLEEIIRDVKNAQKIESPESETLYDQAKQLDDCVIKFNQALGKWEKRWSWDEFKESELCNKTLKALLNQLTYLLDSLKAIEERGKQLSAVCKRVSEIEKQLDQWLNGTNESQIRWLESTQSRFRLIQTPLSVAEPFSRQREENGGAWIFTSATLSANGNFDYFKNRLGLQDAEVETWDSPFDFSKQAIVYHPMGLPFPNQPDYIKLCLRAIWPILKKLEGRAFLLFTSYRALQEAQVILEKHWDGHLWVQGNGSKRDLLKDFREHSNSILLGTSSFWEGVDIKGDDLRLVMIDKLPFTPPDDPLVQAREAELKKQGLNSFTQIQLPEVIMGMKQGCGRLIRDSKDTGVLVLCDPRLTQKHYGKQIANSLPPIPWVFEQDAVMKFLEKTS